LQAILNGTNSPINEEQLYRHIDHLCTTSTNETNASPPCLLYENLKQVLDDHVQTLLPSLLRFDYRKFSIFYFFLFFYSETNDSTDYLRLLNSIWNDHTVRSVSDINQIDK
jgi:hypothetical protein